MIDFAAGACGLDVVAVWGFLDDLDFAVDFCDAFSDLGVLWGFGWWCWWSGGDVWCGRLWGCVGGGWGCGGVVGDGVWCGGEGGDAVGDGDLVAGHADDVDEASFWDGADAFSAVLEDVDCGVEGF